MDTRGKVVIAVDFGTTYTRVAYGIIRHAHGVDLPSEDRLVDNWPGAPSPSDLVPTVVAYRSDGRLAAFGYEAESLTEGYRCVRYFKRAIVRSAIPRPAQGDSALKSELAAVCDFLDLVYNHVLHTFNRRNLVPESVEYIVIFTVPANYNSTVNQAFRRLIYRTKWARHKVSLNLSEAEAATRHIIHHDIRYLSQFQKRQCFILCDAGGGAVDVASYQVSYKAQRDDDAPGKTKGIENDAIVVTNLATETEFYLHQKGCLNSRECGSLSIDEAFERHLQQKSSQPLSQYDLTKVMKRFVEEKERFEGGESTIYIRMPLPELVGFNITRKEEMRGFFNSPVNQTLKLLRKQIEYCRDQGDEVNAIFLIGGLGSSRYFMDCIRNYVKGEGIRVINPDKPDPGSAVVLGALDHMVNTLTGQPDVLATRICIANYGIIRSDPRDDVRHHGLRDRSLLGPPTGLEMVSNQIDWVLFKGQILRNSAEYTLARHFYRDFECLPEAVWTETIVASDVDDRHKLPSNVTPGLPEVKTACLIRVDFRKEDPNNFISSKVGPKSLSEGREKCYRCEYQIAFVVGATDIEFKLYFQGMERPELLDVKYASIPITESTREDHLKSLSLRDDVTSTGAQRLEDLYLGSSLSALEAGYVLETIGKLLKRIWRTETDSYDQGAVGRVVKVLPKALQTFALKLGYSTPESSICLVVVWFICRWGIEYIKRNFENTYSRKGNIMSVFGAEDLPENKLEGGEAATDFMTSMHAIWASPASGWLVGRLQREIYLSPTLQTAGAGSQVLREIEHSIHSALEVEKVIHWDKAPEACKAGFRIDWNPVNFIQEQDYPMDARDAIELAITLTGSGNEVQAVTTIEYLQQTWPSSGVHIMDLLKDLVEATVDGDSNRSKFSTILPDRIELALWMDSANLMVEAVGLVESVAEIGGIFAWLGSALRSSPVPQGVSYCVSKVSHIRMSNGYTGFRIGFDVVQDHVDIGNGTCWRDMFRNPIVVKGYPIPRRTEASTGLEMPLHVISALVRTRSANVFNDKLYIKCFSTMLVPVRRCGDILVWHYLYHKKGDYLSYLDSKGAHAEDIQFAHLQELRHIIGWCAEAKLYAGARDATYDILPSGLGEPRGDCILEKLTISGGKYFTAGATLAVGVRDTPIHLPPNGYYPRLKWLSKKFVLLWDAEDKRGWLIDGLTVLLHLFRASLKNDMEGLFKDSLLFKEENLIEPSNPYTDTYAVEFFRTEANMEVALWPEKTDIFTEETKKLGGIWDRIYKKKVTCHRVRDQVEQLWNCLEQAICHQLDVTGQNGFKLKGRTRKYLEGWDFRGIAAYEDLDPKIAEIKTFGKGWVDFIRSIWAVTLFGCGFGELIQPANQHNLCDAWATLPKGKYYIAICLSTLRRIMELKGLRCHQGSKPIRIAHDIVWHRSSKIFESCRCKGKSDPNKNSREKHSDIVQVLWPSGSKHQKYLPKRSPLTVGNRGAIIFGHNGRFKWYWDDEGGPIAGAPPPPWMEREDGAVDEDDSALGSSGIGSNFAETASLYSQTSFESTMSQLASSTAREMGNNESGVSSTQSRAAGVAAANLPREGHENNGIRSDGFSAKLKEKAKKFNPLSGSKSVLHFLSK